MNDYIKDNFDTGFLSPYLNFTLFCASFIIAVLAIVARV